MPFKFIVWGIPSYSEEGEGFFFLTEGIFILFLIALAVFNFYLFYRNRQLVKKDRHAKKLLEIQGEEIQNLRFELDRRILSAEVELTRKNLLQDLESMERKLMDTIRQSEKALHESESRFRAVFESTGDGITIWDRNGVNLYANRAALSLAGKSGEDFIGVHIRKGLQNLPAFMELCASRIGDVLKTGERIQRNDAVICDGKRIYSESSYIPIRDAAGEIFAVSLIFRDVTERVRAEEEKEDLLERLRFSQKMEAIGTLAGGIAHDFNNLLSVILGFSEIAMRIVPETDPVYQNLEHILKAGLRAADLVDQILTFSRQAEQKRKPIELHPIIKESLKLLRSSFPPTIDIQSYIEEEIGFILADPIQIQQSVVNLCMNACQAIGEKEGVVEVRLEKREPLSEQAKNIRKLNPGSYAVLSVRDTGCGMDRPTMERIFEPYFSTKNQNAGAGLGLSTVHGIVKSHGGEIWVDSEAGRGSVFEIYLPMIAHDEGMARNQSVDWNRLRGQENILFVDDEEQAVQLGEMALTSLGYRVSLFTHSGKALEAFRADPIHYDAVVTDQVMPFLTGSEMAREMMRIRPDIPIILCTAYSETINEAKAKEMGLRKCIYKPIIQSDLALAIRNALDGITS
ncbi:MAG: ATP-binding protein [Candidatus Omnitrophota bacterium]